MSVNEASLGACENRVKKSTAISKNPGKNGGNCLQWLNKPLVSHNYVLLYRYNTI